MELIDFVVFRTNYSNWRIMYPLTGDLKNRYRLYFWDDDAQTWIFRRYMDRHEAERY